MYNEMDGKSVLPCRAVRTGSTDIALAAQLSLCLQGNARAGT